MRGLRPTHDEERASRRPRVSCALWAGAILLASAAISCQTSGGRSSFWAESTETLVWPPPPDPPRVRYVGAIHSQKELGRSTGIGRRLGRLLLGAKKTALLKPVAVATNGAGLLVVADPGVPTVHFYDIEAQRYWRPKKKHSIAFRSPVGVAVTGEGIVYVADSVMGYVFVLNRKGGIVGRIGEGLLARPTGVALSADESLLHVVDTISCQVVTFRRDGTELGRFGSRGSQPGQFNFPTFISVTPRGNLCIADSLNFRVQILSPEGEFVRAFGQAGDSAGRFVRPKGVGVDRFGNIYVVDAAFENVQVFDAQGLLLLAFGSPGRGPGEFTLPSGIFVDSANAIWVADSFNQRVLVFRLQEDAV